LSTVLYLSYDGMTDPLGRSQVLPYLEGLSKKGVVFHLISFEKKEQYEKGSSSVRELTEKAGIHWHPLTYTKKPPVISTLYDLSRMWTLAKKLHKTHSFNMVHCRSYLSGMVGMRMKSRFGIKYLFDIRGFWADERVEGGLWNLKNPVYKTIYDFFKKKEVAMFRSADAIVSLTQKASVIIASDFKINEDHISVIPCCADLNHFNRDRIQQNIVHEIRESTRIGNHQPVLGYLGAIGTWYMLEEMLEFFKRMLVLHPKAYFLFITPEHQKTIYEKAIQMGIPTNQIGVFSAKREEVPSAISLFDASIFFIRPTFSKSASSPTKQGELMGMGIPIICNTGIGDTDTIVKKYDSGDLVDLNDSLSIDKAIAKLSNTMNLSSEKIISGAEDYFSLEHGVEKYNSIYKHLLN
jgi:glycosyltransferase involved in cell wall biosynthesis